MTHRDVSVGATFICICAFDGEPKFNFFKEMVKCAVLGCKNKSCKVRDPCFQFSKVNKHFTNLTKPQDLEKKRRESRLDVPNRSDLISGKKNLPSTFKHVRVCSRHFREGKPADVKDTENLDCVRTQNLGYATRSKFTVKNTERGKTAKRQAQGLKKPLPRKKHIENPEIKLIKNIKKIIKTKETCETPPTFNEGNGVYVQTDLTMSDLKSMECELLIHSLKNKIKAKELDILKFCKDLELPIVAIVPEC